MTTKEHSNDAWREIVGRVAAAELTLSSADDKRRLAESAYFDASRRLKVARSARNDLIVDDQRCTADVAKVAGVTRARCAQIRLSSTRDPMSRCISDQEWSDSVEQVNSALKTLNATKAALTSANLEYSLAIGAVQRSKDERDEMILSDPRGDVIVSGLAGISRSWCAQIRAAHRAGMAA